MTAFVDRSPWETVLSARGVDIRALADVEVARPSDPKASAVRTRFQRRGAPRWVTG